MNDISTNFASMEDKNYNYQEQGIQLITAFDELVDLDTSLIDGYMVLACDGGKMDVDINGTRAHLNTWDTLILPPHTRLTNYMVSPDIRCDIAIISSEAVRTLLGSHIDEWNRALYVNKTNHLIANDERRKQFAEYINLLEFKTKQVDRRYNKEIVRSIIRCILLDYLELMLADVPEIDDLTVEGQKKVLFQRFLEILSTRHVKHQLVETYAQELCVSPGYLTKVCKELSGKTAMKWIRDYTEQDVSYYLTNSDRSIKEICDDLGFPNLSFFSKFCRRAFGCSPTEYRKKAKSENLNNDK